MAVPVVRRSLLDAGLLVDGRAAARAVCFTCGHFTLVPLSAIVRRKNPRPVCFACIDRLAAGGAPRPPAGAAAPYCLVPPALAHLVATRPLPLEAEFSTTQATLARFEAEGRPDAPGPPVRRPPAAVRSCRSRRDRAAEYQRRSRARREYEANAPAALDHTQMSAPPWARPAPAEEVAHKRLRADNSSSPAMSPVHWDDDDADTDDTATTVDIDAEGSDSSPPPSLPSPSPSASGCTSFYFSLDDAAAAGDVRRLCEACFDNPATVDGLVCHSCAYRLTAAAAR